MLHLNVSFFTGVHGLYVNDNQLTELPEAVFGPILEYGDGFLYAVSKFSYMHAMVNIHTVLWQIIQHCTTFIH